eukprot:1942878-Lingulodinium_polyedra.AAC.1
MGSWARVGVAFACYVQEACRRFHKATRAPRITYSGVGRKVFRTAAQVDVFTVGFLCQPRPAAGKSEGFHDAKGRGQ